MHSNQDVRWAYNLKRFQLHSSFSMLAGKHVLSVTVAFLVCSIACAKQAAEVALDPQHPSRGLQESLALHTDACPKWLDNYEVFHASMRGKPGAKYFVSKPGPGGLGDRMRGMLFSLRLAAAAQRVLLFTWPQPYQVTTFLLPASSINWTVEGLTLQEGPVLEFANGEYHPAIKDGSYRSMNETFVTLQTNMFMDAECPGCETFNSTGLDGGCVWNRLFKLQDDVVKQAEKQLATIFGTPTPHYTAIHLRLGGMRNEEEHSNIYPRIGSRGPLKRFTSAVACANKLSRRRNVTLPLLMITDNHNLRDFIKDNNIPNIRTPQLHATHFANAAGANVEEHKSTFIDLVLLGRAACLVSSPALGRESGMALGGLSGFSHQGLLLGGGTPCHAMYFEC